MIRRRTFLVWAIGGATAATVAAVATVVGVYLRPAGRRAPAIQLPKVLSDLQEGEVIPIQAPQGWALVMADGGGANGAGGVAEAAFVVHTCGKTEVLAAVCSHLGCTLLYHPERRQFECPCHGSTYQPACSAAGRSMFALDGQVIHGPAAFPMAHIKWAPAAAPEEINVEMMRPSRVPGN